MKKTKNILSKIIILILLLIIIPKRMTVKGEYSNPETELRAVWITNLVGDVSAFSSEATFKAEMTNVLNIMEYYNLNAMIFHIRTHNTALYDSELNPVASWWKTVDFSVFDPLEWLIAEAHKRGIEFHAWMNPYRVNPNFYGESLPASNPASNPENLLNYNGNTILNPGLPNVRQFLIDTVLEVIEKYDVDAIHFDDYFYINLGANGAISGTNTILNEPDQNTFIEYKGNYSTTSASDKANWRREQNNIFIEGLHNAITDFNNTNNRYVQLGISPTGIYKNGDGIVTYDVNGKPITSGSQTNGQTHYSSYLFCDSLKWVSEEWIDYILPQSYWATNHPSASYTKVMSWWNKVVKNMNVNLYSGIGVYMADLESNTYNWQADTNELLNQLTYITTLDNVNGASIYSFRYLKNAYNNIVSKSAEQISMIGDNKASWDIQVLLPEIKSMNPVTLSPVANFNVFQNNISWDLSLQAKFYAIYRSTSSVTFTKEELVDVIDGKTNTWVDSEVGNFNYGIVPISYTNTLGMPTAANYEEIFIETDTGTSQGTEVTNNGGVINGHSLQIGFTRHAYLSASAPSQSRLDYTWTSSNESVATISEYGTIKAFNVGSTTIKAIYKSNPTYQGIIEIAVYDKFTVNFVNWDNTLISTQTIISGTDAIAPVNPTRTGYTFLGWDQDYTNVQTTLTINAQFEISTYTVTFKDYDGSILANRIVQYGNDVTPPQVAERDNYVFESWNKSYYNITSNLEITAVYRELFYSIKALTNNNNGVVQVNETSNTLQEGPYGFMATLEVIDNIEAFQFWVTDGKVISFAPTITFMATRNHTLTAYFANENQYAVSFIDSNMLLVDFICVDEGASITTDKLPGSKPGYRFDGWNEVTNVNKHTFIYATFTSDDSIYNVVVNNGTFLNSNETTREVSYGKTVTVSNNDSLFSYWMIDNKIASFNPTYTFSIYQDINITAVGESLIPKGFNLFLNKPVFDEVTKKVAFYGNFDNPFNFDIVEFGVLYVKGEAIDPKQSPNAKTARILNYSPNNEYSVFFTLSYGETVSVCLYAVTNQGEYIYNYSDYESYNIADPSSNITYELDGGNFYLYDSREAMVEDFIADFNNVYQLNTTAENFFTDTYGKSVFNIFNAYDNKWLWLKAYIIQVCEENAYTSTNGLKTDDDGLWRSNIWAFLNQSQRVDWPASFAFTDPSYYNGFWDNILITPPSSYIVGENYSLPKPYKTNYTFGGWYDNPLFSGELVTTIKTTEYGNKAYYALLNK